MTDKKGNFSEQMNAALKQHQAELARFHSEVVNKRPAAKRELELALTVLLVELAGSDENFDQNEYGLIASALTCILGTGRTEVQSLVNQANLALANLRTTAHYGELLRENLGLSYREAILKIVEDIIRSDGEINGHEVYQRNRIAKMLGVGEWQ